MTDAAREPTRAFDDDGNGIVLVPLANGLGHAILDADDFDRLAALGMSGSWFLNGVRGRRYVRVGVWHASGHNIGVARAISGVGSKTTIKYRDGDTTNLRRGNLYQVSGPAKRHDAATIEGGAMSASLEMEVPKCLVR